MINKFIRNFVAKQMAGRSDDGIMITLKDPQRVTLGENIMADLLIRNGIDPRIIRSEQELKFILQQIENARVRDIQNTGIRNTTSAKVFDLEGKEIPKGSKIMGGKAIDDDLPPPGSRGGKDDIAAPVQSSEESLRDMIVAENKKTINKIKQKQKMLAEAIDNQSPSLSGDRKVDADLVAEDLAERMGLVYDDMPTKERLKLYDEAYQALTKKKFDPPEDLATGGRVGLKDGLGILSLDDKGFLIEPSGKGPSPYMLEGFQKGPKLSKEQLKELLRKIKEKDFKIKDPIQLMADGGIMRIGLKDGMNRRTFLKILGGAMSIPIIGKIFKPLKIGKTVTKVPIIKTDNVPGKPEWFDQLVNKVIIEGDDVTKRFATKDREIVHIKKLDDDTNVMVTQDLDEGAVRVEYESPESMYGDPVSLRYKKPNPDEGDPRPTADFDVAESGPVGRADGPDDYSIEIDEIGGTSISDLTSDVSKLKEYATGQKPTIKELMQIKKRKDKAKKITEGGEAEMDAVIERQGEFIENDLVDLDSGDFASGGIARMLGE